jgi:hypothetical protein
MRHERGWKSISCSSLDWKLRGVGYPTFVDEFLLPLSIFNAEMIRIVGSFSE